MSESREQKLIDICFQLVMTLHNHQDFLASKSRDEIAAWVANTYRDCGFPTTPIGSSWGVLIERTRNERLETIRSALEDAALAIYEAAVGEPH
jgi:hypothetical protein